MKTKLLFLSLVLLALSGSLSAQVGQQGIASNPLGGDLTATSASCATVQSCVWMRLPSNGSTATVTLAGTFSQTDLIELSGDGGNTWITNATLSAVGITSVSVSGFSDIRVRCSAFTSGRASVTINVGLLQVQSVVSGSSSSSPSSGIPTVTRGLLADCQLSETSGTTINCGAAGNGTFGAGNAAPVFPSITTVNTATVNIGTAKAMDNFTNAAITTAGNWTVPNGSFTVTSGVVSTASVTGGSGQANAIYTGIPNVTSSQFSMITVQGTPGSGGGLGPSVFNQASGQNYYGCIETNTIGQIFKNVAGTSTNLSGNVTRTSTPVAGDVMILTVQLTSNLQSTGVSLSCTFVSPSGVVQTLTVASDLSFLTGSPGIAGAGTSSVNTISNWRAGTLDITPGQGGLLFGGGQNVLLPASLNSAQTIEVYGCFQTTSNSNAYNALVMGNGNGAASNAVGLVISSAGSGNVVMQGTNHLFALNSSGLQDLNLALPNGCALSAITFGLTAATLNPLDRIYMNGFETSAYGQGARNSLQGVQTVGAFQLGGAAAGSGFATVTYLTGVLYRFRAFSVQVSPAEIAQDTSAMTEYMSGRGVFTSLSSNAVGDTLVAVGDSQTSGSGLGTPNTQAWTQLVTLFTPANSSGYLNSGHPWNMGLGGSTVGSLQAQFSNGTVFAAPDQQADPLYTPSGNRNLVIDWMGTNDLLFGGTSAASGLLDTTANYLKSRKLVGWKTIIADPISRGASGSCTLDTTIQAYNPLPRQAWPVFADGFVDLASFTKFAPNGGAGNCTSTTYFNADNIHPNAYGHSLIAFFFQREINTIFGNHDWNSANTYTVTATAATATTAGSEVGSIATITMAATQPFASGQCVVIAGVTPAGYNTPAGDCYLVLAGATTTQITVTLPVTGLGVITVQGTVVAAQELDQDQYAILGGSAAGPIHTLQTCQGRTGHVIYRMITNTNATPWVITPFQAGETINGGATFTTPVASATNHPIVALKAILTSNSAGGCTWQASIQ